MANERVLIIAVKKADQDEERFESSLEEAISLTETAGGMVVKVVTQNRNQIHPATYIGDGKASEIKEYIEELHVDLVISNDELSAGQIRNLTNRFDVRLIDRSQLILDIFAQRAHTKEGMLQVELAQLEYMLPRLHGQGLALSRLAGGIGTRGPGETKLESDQRHIRRRIDDIKRKLKNVVLQREQYRKRRKRNHAFQIAIVGYTNAGKSTIFNRMTNSESLEENQLFATLDPLTRRLQLPSGFEALITDTVGFIQDLPTALIAAFKSTLEEVTEADFILHVVDRSNPDFEQHQNTVYRLLEELDADTIPMLTVYNKIDLIEGEFIPIDRPYISINAFHHHDIQALIVKIEETLKQEWEQYEFKLDASEGKRIYQLTHQTIVIEKYFNEELNQYIVNGYIPKNHPLKGLLEEKE